MPDNDLPSFGPTMAPPTKSDKPVEPFFMVGVDDKPLDTRVIAMGIGIRAEIKVGDRTFSSVVLLHEVVVLRHFYETKAGSGQVRISAAWPPALQRIKPLTHNNLVEEVKRMRESYVTAKQGGQMVKSFELYFGTEPSAQLKRLHHVMREQYEAWNSLFAKAMTRLDADTKDIHPKMRESMATELITEQELERLALIADPSRAGLDQIQLDEIQPADIQVAVENATAAQSVEEIKAQVEADTEEDSPVEKLLDRLMTKGGLDSQRAGQLAQLIGDKGRATNDDLVRILGSKTKADQIKPLLTE